MNSQHSCQTLFHQRNVESHFETCMNKRFWTSHNNKSILGLKDDFKFQEFSKMCQVYDSTAVAYKEEDILAETCAHSDRYLGRKFYSRHAANSGETFDCDYLKNVHGASGEFIN